MRVSRRGRAIGFAALSALCMTGLVNQSFADADLQFAKYVQFVKWSGDYRLRFDNEHFRNPSTTMDRGRFRMRLRLGTDIGLPGKLTIKTRLASGVGEQTSTNQTFGSLGTQKGIFIDRAYLEWKPKDWATLMGGKMANPLWTTYASDAIWDADFNPEGAGEQFSYLLGGFNLFANGLQMVADESNGSTHATANDQYVLSEQVGFETRLPLESRIKIAYANHYWRDAATNAFTGVAITNGGTSPEKSQEGNRKSGASLANDFRVDEVAGELSTWLFRIPVSLQGVYLKNNWVRTPQFNNALKDTGYQAGTIIGKAGTAKGWEVAYFYKYIEADATVADAADSDFGDGGTNRKGHIMWAAYSPFDYLTLQAKYFQTKNIDPTISGSLGSMDRVQIDTVIKW